MRVPAEQIRQQLVSVLRAWGMSAAHADTTAEMMLETDLRGVDSHGISMLPTYDKEFRAGRLNMRPQFKIVREGPATVIRREDYAAPAFWIRQVDLTFDLDPVKTIVASRLQIERNADRNLCKAEGEEVHARQPAQLRGAQAELSGDRRRDHRIHRTQQVGQVIAERERDEDAYPRAGRNSTRHADSSGTKARIVPRRPRIAQLPSTTLATNLTRINAACRPPRKARR